MSAWNRARPHHIVENLNVLQRLKVAAENSLPYVRLEKDIPDYKLRQILAATVKFPDYAGRYAGLGAELKVRQGYVDSRGRIGKAGRPVLLINYDRPEHAQRLDEQMVEEYPDKDLLASLVQQMESTPAPDEEEPTERRSPFDLIRRS